jgi:hypothetical protein
MVMRLNCKYDFFLLLLEDIYFKFYRISPFLLCVRISCACVCIFEIAELQNLHSSIRPFPIFDVNLNNGYFHSLVRIAVIRTLVIRRKRAARESFVPMPYVFPLLISIRADNNDNNGEQIVLLLCAYRRQALQRI